MRFRISAAFTVVGAAALITLGAGCRADSSAQVPAAADLKGTWAQTGAGFERGQPVTWDNQTVVIEAAEGQGFAGFKEYTREGEPPQKEKLNGVIGSNGDILITDEDGQFHGRFVDGKILGQYAEVGDDSAAITIELSRK
ncbi:hypothetical protein [Cyanobium gracile]|uniref:Lipoprotein n=1 Tax=Cyanobium gracile UHCC 0281 TaxID=3110309 RepID=A0ABU5SZD2_9CYAN|nr:hypothetical protein [Cyanobium gracile]MEA5443849.1 hypothetical protein [Cyanobium gracile UHCC 0281]